MIIDSLEDENGQYVNDHYNVTNIFQAFTR